MLNKLLGGGKQPQWKQPPEMGIDPAKQYTATIQTTEGTMTAQLLPAEAPKTVNNFVFLARERFYDGVPFHRVMKGFMDEIPKEYEEAALVDGYTRTEAFLNIVLPQAATGIAATAVFSQSRASSAAYVPGWLPSTGSR